VVIFGASGDLTRRKLMPALYNLALEQWLPAGFSVVGFARREDTDAVFRQHMQEAIETFSRRRPVQPAVWESFTQGLFYIPADFGDPGGYDKLRDALNRIDKTRGTQGNRVFYLATPPAFYADIVRQLGRVGLNHGGRLAGAAQPGWARIIVETTFGRDLASAQELNRDN